MHELTHWHAYILAQLRKLPADFTIDESDGSTTPVKSSGVRARAIRTVLVGKLFGYRATGNPYSAAVSAVDLPSVVVPLCPATIKEWRIPDEVKHNSGKFEMAKGCTHCRLPRQDHTLHFCDDCVRKSLATSLQLHLTVLIVDWEPCLVCGMAVAPLDAAVLRLIQTCCQA